MTVLPLLAELHRQDIRLWAEGDRLRCNAPADLFTPGLREQLQRRKGEILEFLRSTETLSRPHRAIVPLQPHGPGMPVFGVGGHNGDVFCYLAFAQHLGHEHPFYGLQPPGLDGQRAPLTRIGELAAYFAEQICAFHPSGPCIISGYCAGGLTAFELGRQLVRAGVAVNLIALFGAPYATRYRRLALFRDRLDERLGWLATHSRALTRMSWRDRRSYISVKLSRLRAQRALGRSAVPDPVLALRSQVERATLAGARRYTPERFDGRVCVFLPNAEWERSRNMPLAWGAKAREVEVYTGPEGCTRDTMLREPYAAMFARRLVWMSSRLRAVPSGEPRP